MAETTPLAPISLPLRQQSEVVLSVGLLGLLVILLVPLPMLVLDLLLSLNLGLTTLLLLHTLSVKQSLELAVIAYQEIPSDLLLQPAAMIRPDELAPRNAAGQATRPAA
jgi:type III secretory pathway component EscV